MVVIKQTGQEIFKDNKTTKRQLWSLQKQHNFLKEINGYAALEKQKTERTQHS